MIKARSCSLLTSLSCCPSTLSPRAASKIPSQPDIPGGVGCWRAVGRYASRWGRGDGGIFLGPCGIPATEGGKTFLKSALSSRNPAPSNSIAIPKLVVPLTITCTPTPTHSHSTNPHSSRGFSADEVAEPWSHFPLHLVPLPSGLKPLSTVTPTALQTGLRTWGRAEGWSSLQRV